MSKAKILIVEDEMIVAASLSRQLQKRDYEVIGTVNSGEKAIQSVSRQCPDIILMDISIRGSLDGIQTADILNREQYEIPVIFLSAFSDVPHQTQAAAIQNSQYLAKPFPFSRLLTLIEKALAPRVISSHPWEYLVS